MKYILMALLMGLCLLLGGCREGSAPQPTQAPGEQSSRIDQEEVAVAIVTYRYPGAYPGTYGCTVPYSRSYGYACSYAGRAFGRPL